MFTHKRAGVHREPPPTAPVHAQMSLTPLKTFEGAQVGHLEIPQSSLFGNHNGNMSESQLHNNKSLLVGVWKLIFFKLFLSSGDQSKVLLEPHGDNPS